MKVKRKVCLLHCYCVMTYGDTNNIYEHRIKMIYHVRVVFFPLFCVFVNFKAAGVQL